MSYLMAMSDFREARRQAAMEQILARLTGQSAELLSYDEVRDKLKAKTDSAVYLKEIPLDAIVGSVGRYNDFTRSFLPRRDSDRERWARVQMKVTDLAGLPPIAVYQIGETYFVRDGNHRVSVARQLGATHIQAYVTQVQSRVPISPGVQPDDLILKAEYAEFLERTDLDTMRPGADLGMTSPGRYRILEEHIEVHRYFMGLEQGREIPYEEAVESWYDQVYLPVVQVIREQGILRDFPDRTETDLYLWVSEHRSALEEALGWEVRTGDAAADLAARFSSRPRRVAARVGGKILEAVTPDELEAGPPPGRWRKERLLARRRERREDCLFADILVPLSGEEDSWVALDLALEVARREGGRLLGLHIVSTKGNGDTARIVQGRFERHCQAVGVPGKLVTESGRIARLISDRARWTDLVVVNLAHPPVPRPVAKLTSGFRTLLLQSPRPVLAVPAGRLPDTISPLSRALLAYDSSRKAEEALFVAAYVAGRWQIPLVVLSVEEKGSAELSAGADAAEALTRAREYLMSNNVPAVFVTATSHVAQAILETAKERACDLILMGGYGHSPVVEVVLGSALDEVLRQSQWPILICR